MLDDFIKKLTSDLELETPQKDEKTKSYLFKMGDIHVDIKELEPGIYFKTNICESPKKKKEDLFMKLMQANLIGQGTGGAVIGLDKEEKFLTLSLALAYEMNYRAFKESLEDFVNYLVYWREQVEKARNDDGFEKLL